MIPPIFISGAGVVSAIGFGKAETLASLRSGRSGIAPRKCLETQLEGVLLGEVKATSASLAALCGASAELPRTSLLGIIALKEALEEAGIEDLSAIPLIGGTTVGGMDLTEKSFPVYNALHDCGASTEAIAAHFGGALWSTTLSTACSSAANAILCGANLIRCGLASRVAVGGAEALSSFHLNGFNSLMIVDKEPCRPFDKSRAGLNLGEGAAFLILESEESLRGRGGKALVRLSGFGNACDAYHQTASSPTGEGAFLAMRKALSTASLRPEDIDYVNAHGTGTPDNDAAESAALRRVFGEALPPVSSTKAFTGHTTSASGSIEAVICLLALSEGFIPRQLNWKEADPACIIPSVNELERPLRHVLCNSFGFGGNDTSLLISNA